MPYRVDVPEELLGTVPTQIRTRIWLALAKIAQGSAPARLGQQMVGEGYRLTYQIDASTRTVTLLGVDAAVPVTSLADLYAS